MKAGMGSALNSCRGSSFMTCINTAQKLFTITEKGSKHATAVPKVCQDVGWAEVYENRSQVELSADVEISLFVARRHTSLPLRSFVSSSGDLGMVQLCSCFSGSPIWELQVGNKCVSSRGACPGSRWYTGEVHVRGQGK